MRRDRKRRVSFLVSLIVCVFIGLTLVQNFVIFSTFVRSDSMESDISENSCLFVLPLSRNPKRGDVVYLSRLDGKKTTAFQKFVDGFVSIITFQQVKPYEMTRRMTGKANVRRVLALPGDTIYMKDYILFVKPAGETQFLTEYELASKPYNIHIYSVPADWDGLGACGDLEETVLKADECFVLADNRISSADSRLWGPVKMDRIKGKVVLEFFPFRNFRFF